MRARAAVVGHAGAVAIAPIARAFAGARVGGAATGVAGTAAHTPSLAGSAAATAAEIEVARRMEVEEQIAADAAAENP